MLPEQVLKKYYGYDNFRPLQLEIIEAVLAKKDTLALLPTGGGKSICFQIPALLNEGLCLVVSPLIALIKDQVQSMKKKGIAALAIYAGMSYADVRKTLQNAAFGNYKFLYVSPERLQTALFLEYLPALKPSLIAVDEAHCISQWGYDFRPAYLNIALLRAELEDVPIIALTASATPAVQDDICTNLQFAQGYNRFQQSFVRPNLSYSIFSPSSKENKLLAVLNNVQGSAIVYCKSRRQTLKIADLLRSKGIDADYYHAGLLVDARSAKQDAWIKNTLRVIVCTNAFGMGIDKPDVRAVVHFDVPDCVENYYQEAGRAGRDGKRAYAVLLHTDKEIDDILYKLQIRYPSTESLKNIYLSLMNYLQVPAGSGEGQSYDMDVALFAKAFKLNILQATYGIQALAQEGLISFTEMMFKQSTLVFCINKNDLQEYITQLPELAETIKGLLRSYEGIFDYPCSIYESSLAQFLKIPIPLLMQQLQQLHSSQVIQYSPASDKPQVYLLKNRMYTDDFVIDAKAIAKRKGVAAERANSMATYLKLNTQCRSKYIAQYFGDSTVPNCNICDNCINNTSAKLPDAEFNACAKAIINILKNKAETVEQILQLMKPIRQRSVWQVINFLQAEQIIAVDDKNRITLK